MIRGAIDEKTGHLLLEGQLTLPLLGFRCHVSFLVDTGADTTFVLPEELAYQGLDLHRLADFPTSTGRGIGGLATVYVVPAVLTFRGTDGVHTFGLNVVVPTPQPRRDDDATEDDGGGAIQSLLGLDILRNWRMTYDGPGALLTFEAPAQPQRVP